MTTTGSGWTSYLGLSTAGGSRFLIVGKWLLGTPLVDGIVNGVFAVIVFTAIMAVLLDVYGEVVLAAAVLLAIWLAVQVFGPSSLLAILLIMIAAGCRIAAALTAANLEEAMPRKLVLILDALLTEQDDPQGREQQ